MSDSVNVKGIGPLPKAFDLSFDSLNLYAGPKANHHNEGRVKMDCEPESRFWGNDVFSMVGYKTGGGYHLEIKYDTEYAVQVKLFQSGSRILLDYSEETQNWQLMATTDNRIWTFCDASGSLDILFNSLSCYLEKTETKNEDAVKSLLESLKTSKTPMTDNAMPYVKSKDCSDNPPELPALGDDGAILWD